jgi:hypothetical protein
MTINGYPAVEVKEKPPGDPIQGVEFGLPDYPMFAELTTTQLRDALASFGDTSNMDRSQLIKLWDEADTIASDPRLSL